MNTTASIPSKNLTSYRILIDKVAESLKEPLAKLREIKNLGGPEDVEYYFTASHQGHKDIMTVNELNKILRKTPSSF